MTDAADSADPEYAPSSWDYAADHVDRYLKTGGEDGFDWADSEVIVLETVGRKSGKLRRAPLIRVHDGENYLVIASMGGAPKHPVWYLNLVANPDVRLYDRDEVHELRARTADPDEKARRWPAAVAMWPAYDEYQAATDRDIPLVVLEPR